MFRYILPVLLVAVVHPSLAEDWSLAGSSSSPYKLRPASPANDATTSTAETMVNSYAAPGHSGSASLSGHLSAIDHLVIAAEHLETAGLKEEAQRVRKLAAAERARAEQATIIVNVRMIELPLAELAKVSALKYGGTTEMSVLDLLRKMRLANQPLDSDRIVKSPDAKLLPLIDALVKDHLAIPRAEPSVIALAGRPAYTLVGGEVGYQLKDANGGQRVEFKEYGTRVDVLATLLPDNRIHLDARLRVSELDPETSTPGFPSLKSRETETGIELRSGQTIFIGGFLEERTVDAGKEPAAPDDKPAAKPAAKEVRHITEKFESFVTMKAEIAPKEMNDVPIHIKNGKASFDDGSAHR